MAIKTITKRHQHYIDNKEKLDEQHRQWCIDNREKLSAYHRQYHKDNKTRINKDNRLRREKNKRYLDDYKLSKGCSVCGYNKCAVALDFHHNGDKDFVISESLHRNINSERFKEELSKCIILCANCHRELHAKAKEC